MIDAIKRWANARFAELSTKLGATIGAATAPEIYDQASKAARDYQEGNISGFVFHGLPALIGVIAILTAIIRPEKPDHEQLKTAFAKLTPEEVQAMLAEKVCDDGH